MVPDIFIFIFRLNVSVYRSLYLGAEWYQDIFIYIYYIYIYIIYILYATVIYIQNPHPGKYDTLHADNISLLPGTWWNISARTDVNHGMEI